MNVQPLLRRVAVIIALFTLAGCGAEPPPEAPPWRPLAEALAEVDPFDDAAFQAWRADLPQLDDGRFVVGDLPYPDGPELVEEYHRMHFPEAFGGSDGGLTLVDRSDNRWSGAERLNLSYCVSDGFGARKGQVVTALHVAARAWESAADVRFIYRPEHDADCDDDNEAVMFNVEPGCTSDEGNSGFGAMAFFPWWDRDERELLVCQYYDKGGRTLAGVMKHELGHVLGFPHEHDRAECLDSGFDRVALSHYDALSVMHYRGLCGSPSDDDYFLSGRDKAAVAAIYGTRRTRRVALRAGDGHYFKAMGGGGGPLRASADRLGPWESFELVYLGGDKVALRAWGGGRQYVRAQQGGPGKVTVDGWHLADDTTFTMKRHHSGRQTFRAQSGAYLAAHGNGGGAISATTYGWPSLWNRFELVPLDDEPVALESAHASHDGRHVVIDRDHDVRADTRRIDRESTFSVVPLDDGAVALRTVEGRYLTAEGGGGGDVRADRDVVGAWETFLPIEHSDGSISFRADNGRHLRVTSSRDLRADATGLWTSTRFDLRALRGAKLVAIQAPDGQYTAAQWGGGERLIADAKVIDIWELYDVIDLGDGAVAFRTHNGSYLTARSGGGGLLRADAEWIDIWETFTLVPQSKGRVALRTHNGHFVRALWGGGHVLDARAKAAGPWERFRLQEIF